MSKKPYVGPAVHHEIRIDHDAILLKLQSLGPSPERKKIEFYCALTAQNAKILAHALEKAALRVASQT